MESATGPVNIPENSSVVTISWSEVARKWCDISFDDPIGKNEVLQEFIWFNSNICIGNNPVFYKKWYNLSIKTVGDLLNEEREFLSHVQLSDKYGTSVNFL